MTLGFYFNMKRCTGCRACQVACQDRNDLRVGIAIRKVDSYVAGTYPNAMVYHFSGACNHCENPACVAACPTGASHIREDGIIAIDTDVCIGCQSCIAACPYPGVRQYNGEEPEFDVDFALGAADAPKHVYNTVEKCNFCFERLERGEVPYCMEACPMRCRIIGDLDDPESEVSRLLAEREYFRLNEEAGTEPNVYYLK